MPAAVGIENNFPLALEQTMLSAHFADWSVTIGISVFIRKREICLCASGRRQHFQLSPLKAADIEPFNSVVFLHGMDTGAYCDIHRIMFKSAEDGKFYFMIFQKARICAQLQRGQSSITAGEDRIMCPFRVMLINILLKRLSVFPGGMRCDICRGKDSE